ncbi:hypothetical protein [Fastidiosibacter lacustris]|uniref:hypothetical protein n=1 Tax=Fastidiosibacter lacustris TaxID=2056695 RepID=UPI000E351375|nr:hypothetical protein [Fastidiosibacter lacustris]
MPNSNVIWVNDKPLILPKNKEIYLNSRDQNSRYISCSDSFFQLLGVDESIIGQSDEVLPNGISEYGDQFAFLERLIETTQKPLEMLDVHYFNNRLTAIYSINLPKLDNGNVIGTNFYGWQPNNSQQLIELSIRLSLLPLCSHKGNLGQNSLAIVNTFDILSAREFEIVYLLSLGYTSKQVGFFLQLSSRTIDDVIYNVKTKYNFLGKKNKLLEYLVVEKHMHIYIPKAFFSYLQSLLQLLK